MNHTRTQQLFFYTTLFVALLFFCWSRFDGSNRIYYFGDGTNIINMIALLVEGYGWDESLVKLIEQHTHQKELDPFINLPSPDGHYYNFSGYVMVAATVCKVLYAIGAESLSITQIVHGLNVVFQALTLGLLFGIGRRLGDRNTGLLAIVFFVAFPLAVMEAHYERQESWLCLLGTALIYVALRFHEAQRLACILMGVLIGLSITAKYSHVFLGIVPAILIASEWRRQKLSVLVSYGALVSVALIVAMAINVPTLFLHFDDYLAEISGITKIYQRVNYPYAMEHYSYTGQLGVILTYFAKTLGWLWLAFLLVGLLVLLVPRWRPANIKTSAALAITTPVLFLVFYFAAQLIFIERNFATVEGLISIISAIGITQLARQRLVLLVVLMAATLFVPIKLDMVFVNHYVQKPENPPRRVFESKLKTNFEGFWIKNVYFTHNMTGEPPEKAPKMPRLYRVEDLNEHWSRHYVEKLQASGFSRVAVYCSEFSHLPPNNLTIYHSAAKYHYFVRHDEWPAGVANDYFLNNCP